MHSYLLIEPATEQGVLLRDFNPVFCETYYMFVES